MISLIESYFNESVFYFRACDSCEEWYHGDCINISEREAKYIKNYFCDRCREEDPTLKTRFRPQKRENEGDISNLTRYLLSFVYIRKYCQKLI